MSALEIIEKIKALPAEEQREVFDFFRQAKKVEPPSVRYASDLQASAASDAVVKQFPEVFRRLAE